eukprot:COSAG01_NODE_9571_length_2406_cov_4.430429_1_plen_29_part_10
MCQSTAAYLIKIIAVYTPQHHNTATYPST